MIATDGSNSGMLCCVGGGPVVDFRFVDFVNHPKQNTNVTLKRRNQFHAWEGQINSRWNRPIQPNKGSGHVWFKIAGAQKKETGGRFRSRG